jgi:hypothetical protein
MTEMKMILTKLNKRIVLLLLSLSLFFTAASFTYGYYDDDYPEVDNAFWEGHIARWDSYGYATRFEVILYRNGHRVTMLETSREEINLSQYIHRGSGDYYFEVRPYNRHTGWGNWTSSDTIYMEGRYYDRYYDDRYYDDRYYDSRYNDYYYDNRFNNDVSYAKNPGPPVNNPVQTWQTQNSSNIIMPGSGKSNVIMPGSNQQVVNNNVGASIAVANKQNITVPTPQILNQQPNGENPIGKFVEAYGVWFFIYNNGTPATNVWVQYKNKWYYVDMAGIMAVGLYTINGTTYYLQSDGSMAIGSFVIDGLTHYFDNNGAMVY